MLDAAYPKEALNHWKSSFLAQLRDDAIDTMFESFARCPTPMGQILREHFHGAATRAGVVNTAARPTAAAMGHSRNRLDFMMPHHRRDGGPRP